MRNGQRVAGAGCRFESTLWERLRRLGPSKGATRTRRWLPLSDSPLQGDARCTGLRPHYSHTCTMAEGASTELVDAFAELSEALFAGSDVDALLEHLVERATVVV